MELLGNFFSHNSDKVRYLKANSRRKCITVEVRGLVWTPDPATDQELSRGKSVVQVGKGSPKPHSS